MVARKTAIAVPEDLLREVDEVAAARRESRSKFINHVLRAAVRARRDAMITKRLNEVFAKEVAPNEEALDEAGTPWNDERW